MPELFRYDVSGATEPPLLSGLFLGWQQMQPPFRSFLAGSMEDSVAILGPPRVGKTSGVLVPQAMTWPGSLISASTKPDVLRATRGRRLDIALQRGGGVYVYAPTDTRQQIAGVPAIHWSPADGCEDPNVCEIRVQKLLGPEKPGEDGFFRQAAATVLRGFFHATALSGCGMRRMKGWIDAADVDEAVSILLQYESVSYAADGYASALRGIANQGGNTLSSTFGTVSEKLAAIVGNAAALANAEVGDFDIDAFLRAGSSLFIVSPEDTQSVVAPLVAALIEAIVSRAYGLAAQQSDGRIDPPLLMLLDEVGAIAPLPSLPAIMAQGAGQGVLCVWAAQSITQLRARWGDEWANAIWGASTQKLVFGNLADTDLLERISQMFGDYDRRVSQTTGLQQLAAVLGRGSVTPPTLMRERKLQVAQLHGQPPGTACLLALTPQGPAVEFVGTPPAGLTPPFAACQQSEAEVQRALDANHGLTPLDVQQQSLVDAAFRAMLAAEQNRFRQEESTLLDRIAEMERMPPDRRARELERDPRLAREIAAARRIAALPYREQLQQRLGLISQFADKTVPSFTLVSAYSREQPSPKRPLRRQSDRY